MYNYLYLYIYIYIYTYTHIRIYVFFFWLILSRALSAGFISRGHRGSVALRVICNLHAKSTNQNEAAIHVVEQKHTCTLFLKDISKIHWIAIDLTKACSQRAWVASFHGSRRDISCKVQFQTPIHMLLFIIRIRILIVNTYEIIPFPSTQRMTT